MKKLCPFVLLFSLHVSAQDLSTKLSRAELNKEIPANKYDVRVKDADGESPGFTNNIPSPVLRSFTERYDYVNDVSWVIDTRQVTASFLLDGKNLIVTFNRDGSWVCTRKTYAGNQLGMRLNNILQSEIQKGYRVSYVTEVEHEANTNYEISLQNEKKWLMIRVQQDSRDGSIDIIDRDGFTKG